MKISFREGTSFFHHTDPLSKLTWGILVAVWLMSIRDITGVVGVSAIIFLIAIKGASIPLRSYVKAVIFLMIGWVWLIAFQGLVRSGPGIDVAILHFSYSGIQAGSAIVLRTIGLVASSLAFSTTTTPKDLTLAMIGLGFPYRIAHVAYLSLRFLPLFERDLRTIKDVQRLRGDNHGYRTMKRMFLAMLSTQMRRVDDTTIALETRAFGLYRNKTHLEKVWFNSRGILLLIMTAVLICSYIAIKVFQQT